MNLKHPVLPPSFATITLRTVATIAANLVGEEDYCPNSTTTTNRLLGNANSAPNLESNFGIRHGIHRTEDTLMPSLDV